MAVSDVLPIAHAAHLIEWALFVPPMVLVLVASARSALATRSRRRLPAGAVPRSGASLVSGTRKEEAP